MEKMWIRSTNGVEEKHVGTGERAGASAQLS